MGCYIGSGHIEQVDEDTLAADGIVAGHSPLHILPESQLRECAARVRGRHMKVIVTGGAGFIGSAVCRHLIRSTDWSVVNLDKLTYAANLASLASIAASPRYRFIQADIADREAVRALFEEVRPDAVLNLAAESHVDRSIDSAGDFIHTNIIGTFVLLEEARAYCDACPGAPRAFRFHHVSTDEVFGELGPTGKFTETTPYDPSRPIPRARRRPTIWSAPGDAPMAFRC